MISLPHGCWCSGIAGDPKKGTPDTLSVYPKNWNKRGASTDIRWYIQYYFHDPAFKDDSKLKYGKLVILKDMNRFKDLEERREATRDLMDCVILDLKIE